jgi:hypothetical protein
MNLIITETEMLLPYSFNKKIGGSGGEEVL